MRFCHPSRHETSPNSFAWPVFFRVRLPRSLTSRANPTRPRALRCPLLLVAEGEFVVTLWAFSALAAPAAGRAGETKSSYRKEVLFFHMCVHMCGTFVSFLPNRTAVLHTFHGTLHGCARAKASILVKFVPQIFSRLRPTCEQFVAGRRLHTPPPPPACPLDVHSAGTPRQKQYCM